MNECFEKVSDHPDYKMWQEEVVNIPLVTFASEEEKESYYKKEDMKKVANAKNSKVLGLSKMITNFNALTVHQRKHLASQDKDLLVRTF